jgi:SAM-dependent methyltransferase
MVKEFHGVDVDEEAIRWAAGHLRGSFSIIHPQASLFLPSEALDVVYAVSVFTHLGEHEQDHWLREIRRVLRPGGLFLATTHSPELSLACPGLRESDHHELRENGFLHVDRSPDFRERTTFHSAGYL